MQSDLTWWRVSFTQRQQVAQERDENSAELHVSILSYFSSLAPDKYENSGQSHSQAIKRISHFHKSSCATSVQAVRNTEQQQEHLLYVPLQSCCALKCVRFLRKPAWQCLLY